jgi:hypothetical protein
MASLRSALEFGFCETVMLPLRYWRTGSAAVTDEIELGFTAQAQTSMSSAASLGARPDVSDVMAVVTTVAVVVMTKANTKEENENLAHDRPPSIYEQHYRANAESATRWT